MNQAIQQTEFNTNLPVGAENTTDLLLDSHAMTQIQAVARMMANGRATVPQHLQKNEADCFAVCIQAAQWKMNPFVVAQKTHLVGGTLGYEAQLVNAVVSSSTAIVGGFHYEWFGAWERVIGNFKEVTNPQGKTYIKPNWALADEKGLGVRVWATRRGEDEPKVLELLLSQAQVRNSTLWASDPKQQLAYLGVKRWARLYAPAVIMGVYTVDELEPSNNRIRDVNPRPNTAPKAKGSTLNSVIDEPQSDMDLVAEFHARIDDTSSVSILNQIASEIGVAVEENRIYETERKELLKHFKQAKQFIAQAEEMEAQEAAAE
ncbi:recombinase RecT [Shewanella avicenniae]|uniref:Recombinase RecT n=1 Tax=Shewanella avicenniae TaxID=2814294 RepID=A0ABX7QM14_9GAMM|nr:RecT family recombinase [Shewanella avicenniae]QSX32492.1 recombinase RecT [Shewanella avicenniae]